jgi:hypothetical protein
MAQRSHPITFVASRAAYALALLAAAHLAGCVAVTGTGATVDPAAVDAAAAKCAPGTSSTSTAPCDKDKPKQ